ncbi:hypothetical protein Tco_1208670 [Tanacetum coccineum]
MERSHRDIKIYSGSATKLLFAILHSLSIRLRSLMNYANKLPSGGENGTTSFIIFSDTKLNVEIFSGHKFWKCVEYLHDRKAAKVERERSEEGTSSYDECGTTSSSKNDEPEASSKA